MKIKTDRTLEKPRGGWSCLLRFVPLMAFLISYNRWHLISKRATSWLKTDYPLDCFESRHSGAQPKAVNRLMDRSGRREATVQRLHAEAQGGDEPLQKVISELSSDYHEDESPLICLAFISISLGLIFISIPWVPILFPNLLDFQWSRFPLIEDQETNNRTRDWCVNIPSIQTETRGWSWRASVLFLIPAPSCL